MRSAIVLGTELPRATAIIQALGRRGVPIVAMDHRLRMPGSYSRYITTRLIEEHERVGESDKIGSGSKWHFSSAQAMEKLKESNLDGSVLLPTNDDYLILVSRNHEELARKYVLTTPSWETLYRVMDKEQVYSMAAAAGIDVPAFFSPADPGQAREAIKSLDFRTGSYIFKLHPWAPGPADLKSGAMTRPAGSSGSEAMAIYQEIFDRTGQLAIIQEVVPGSASVCVGVTLLTDKHRHIISAYASQRLQLQTYSRGGDRLHPYELGANVFARTVHDPEAIKLAGRLVEISGMYGVVTVEFRRSHSDNRLKLIKMDPRHVNAAGLAATIGLDIPWIQYSVFCDMPAERRFDYPRGTHWVWPDRWLRILLDSRKRGMIKVRDLLRLVIKARSVAYFSIRDLRPFLRAMGLELSRRRKKAGMDGRSGK